MNLSLRMALGLAATASLALAAQAHAADAGGVKAGVLTCNVGSGWGLIFGSTRDVNCTYTAADNHTENYVGKINKYGVDIGYQHAGIMAWAVLAPSANVAPGALAGNYGGVTAGASAGVGANANALVGGNDKTISLQPLSVEGAVGVNVAAGVASLELSKAS
ncbi:MAG: DUF992 domain-containing protein [Caulobacteraceae bacterium]|nr:DUF992 domain-containing protein [Caulobacteraceae bacterium]